MAFFFFCAVVTVATFGLQVDATCSEKLTLDQLDIIDRSTGQVMGTESSPLPLKADKYLTIRYSVTAHEALNSNSYTASLHMTIVTYDSLRGRVEETEPCPSNIVCEYPNKSCSQLLTELGVTGVTCPLYGTLPPEEIVLDVIGDLTGGVNSFVLLFLQSAELHLSASLTDNTTGEQVACIHRTIYFYKD